MASLNILNCTKCEKEKALGESLIILEGDWRLVVDFYLPVQDLDSYLYKFISIN